MGLKLSIGKRSRLRCQFGLEAKVRCKDLKTDDITPQQNWKTCLREAASAKAGERVNHSSPQQSWGVFWHILINCFGTKKEV